MRQVCGYRLIMFGVRVVQMPSIVAERRTGRTGVLPVRRKAGIVRQVRGYRLIMFGVRVVQMPSIAAERRTGCTGVLPVRRKAGIVRQVCGYHAETVILSPNHTRPYDP